MSKIGFHHWVRRKYRKKSGSSFRGYVEKSISTTSTSLQRSVLGSLFFLSTISRLPITAEGSHPSVLAGETYADFFHPRFAPRRGQTCYIHHRMGSQRVKRWIDLASWTHATLRRKILQMRMYAR